MSAATPSQPIFSHRKVLIRRTERLLPLFVLVMLVAAQALRMGAITAAQVESKLLLVFLVFLWGSTVWLGLAIEFVAVVRGRRVEDGPDPTMSWHEFAAFHRWCPAWIKVVAYVAGVGLGVYVMAFIGPVGWSSSREFTRGDALGLLVYFAGFSLLGWPALASASRMPGSYAENFVAVRSARGSD